MMRYIALAVGAWNVYDIVDGQGSVWNWVAAAIMFGMFFVILIEDGIHKLR